jgi:transcription factor C subunit 3
LNETLAPVKILLERPVPLLYWAGYTSVKLVSPPRIARWTVQLHDSPPRFCFPRRWLDTQGNPVRSVWEAGLRAVMSVAVFRPGISQASVRSFCAEHDVLCLFILERTPLEASVDL